MPSRNIVKDFAPESYYHIYNRGVAKQPIFLDSRDKQRFLALFERHLSHKESLNGNGLAYRKFTDDIELLCYCLMGNHFHLLVYQAENVSAITDFMRSVLTAYTMYFNRRHKRVGPLFQSVYKSSRISTDSYLLHISRYIHLNPRGYKSYHYSSLAHYLGTPSPEWLNPNKILDLFAQENYLEFLEDYEDHKASLEEIKYELADS